MLSSQQIECYDLDGYLVLAGLLGEDDMAPVRAAMTEKVDMIAGDFRQPGDHGVDLVCRRHP